jgi:hypothetical protein
MKTMKLCRITLQTDRKKAKFLSRGPLDPLASLSREIIVFIVFIVSVSARFQLPIVIRGGTAAPDRARPGPD